MKTPHKKLERVRDLLLQLCKEEGVHFDVDEACFDRPHNSIIVLVDDDNWHNQLELGEVFPES